MKKILFFLSLSIMLFSSCTMEKRTYRSGYNVEWNKDITKGLNNTHLKSSISHINNSALDDIPCEETIMASSDNSPLLLKKSKNPSNFPSLVSDNEVTTKSRNYIFLPVDSCDNIIFKNGEEVKGKVLEINRNEIKFKRCDNLDGPVIVVQKVDVFIIQYFNGTKDVISAVTKKNKEVNKKNRSLEDYSVIGFIIAFLGFLGFVFTPYAPIVAGVLSLLFGIIGLIRINKSPGKLYGKFFAIASLVLGAVLLLVSIILLSGG